MRRIFGVSLHSLRDKELLKSVSGASVSCYYTLNEVERDGTTGKLLYTSGNSTDLDVSRLTYSLVTTMQFQLFMLSESELESGYWP